jgi:acyl-coenzyme A synthetase/AMP-(fatty) acid ligase
MDEGETLARVVGASASRITLYTSGSTGLPKAVRQSVANLARAVRRGARHGDDVWGFAYNPSHIAGVQVLLQALLNRNPLVNLFGQPRDTVFASIERHGVTHLSATPTFYRMLLPASPQLPSVRSVTLGGERTDTALIERLRPLFPGARFRNLYASTEAGTLLSTEGDQFAVPIGWEDRIRIAEGRLLVHASLLGEFEDGGRIQGGWYDTGDVVEAVEGTGNRFRITSRDRDWVNVGGNKVNPGEVEAVLLEHPGVREARVFGRPHTMLGTFLCAEFVPGPTTPTETELRKFLAGRLQPFKVPRHIRAVDGFERTRTGKLRRGDGGKDSC